MIGSTPTAEPLGLLVDDDDLYLRTLQRSLRRRGFTTLLARGVDDAVTAAREHRPAFALIDLRLGRDSGLALIEPLKAAREDMRILLVTGYASIATAVEAIKRGADNYLTKPVTADTIVRALNDESENDTMPENTMVPLARVEWEHIQQALAETQGNISAAARLLGTHRRSLQRKLAKRPGPERKLPGDSGE
ncbi:MAG: response regulator [Steroidobacteraceae bacterium]|nr:response regulator [Steroidobacteraceae bacterium]